VHAVTAAHAPSRRAGELFHENLRQEQVFTDRLFAGLMVLQFVGCVLAALLISPRTWIGAQSELHVHVWAAIGIGGVLSALPVALAITRPGTRATRHVIAVAQAMFSALLIHVMGGRIEAHFHVFGSLAFLAFYRDIKVLLSATAVVALDHFLRGVYWPESVFGIASAARWRWLEHAGWVVFEDVFLILSIARARRQARGLADATASLERSHTEVSRRVDERTRELAEALAAAQAADQAKTDFLANMSHEIRTPMTAILGYAELLDGDARAEDPAPMLASIRSNASHLLAIINDILDISKIEAGQMRVETIRTNPAAVLRDVAFLVKPRATDKGLRFAVECDTPIPASIRTDPTRLRQILLNLAGNAVKFTDEGSVSVRVSCDAATQQLRFRIDDTGIGMTPDQQRLIQRFNAFSQADTSVTRCYGGSGLGLSISNALAGLLGGSILVESRVGEGSSFTLTVATGDLAGVPMATPDRAGPEPAAPPAAQSTARDDRPLAETSIMLVEDGPDNQKLIAFHLRKAGAEVTVCENGLVAAEAIERSHDRDLPALVLMDMQMPVLDGYSATRRLRRGGFTLPIVALTAHAMSGDRQKCIDAGCDDYLTKPVDRAALVECCRRWVAGDPNATRRDAA
jgi:signal transduction histidine kinase/ActR/RegA family two-component response regulator